MHRTERFEALVHEHASGLGIFIESLCGDVDLADDLFQETLMVAWRRLDDFDAERPFGPWVRGIARTLVLAQLRRSQRDGLALSPEAMAVLEDRCDALQERRGDTIEEKTAILRSCVERLPTRYRTAIRARYLDEVRGARLARTLGTTPENTKKLLQRGRALLARCFDRQLKREEELHGNSR